jgi:FAD/FMN-containing dehydrogenase
MNAENNDQRELAISELKAKVGNNKVLTLGPAFEEARRVWNAAVTRRPLVIVLCETTSDVVWCVSLAVEFGLRLSVRGGGHDWAGRAVQGELVVDLSRMRSISIDGQLATVGGGAASIEVAEAAARVGMVPVTGNIGCVGMAGLALGGGYGPLTSRFGMASDNLVGAEVVTADGRVVQTDETHEPDLFWALRGGGGNFGVVTRLLLRLHPMTDLSAGVIGFPWAQAKDVLGAYDLATAMMPDQLTLTTALGSQSDGMLGVTMSVAWCGEREKEESIVDEVKDFGVPNLVQIRRADYVQLLRDADHFVPHGVCSLYRTVTLSALHSRAVDEMVAALENRSSPFSFIVLHSFHGFGETIPLASTAFGIRDRHFVIGIYALWQSGDNADTHRAWANQTEEALMPYALASAYPNYFGSDRPDQAELGFGLNTSRILKVKAHYDPKSVFSAICLPKGDR